MGRELKRVPLDFSWPLKTVWKGYKNPYFKQCPDCASGASVSGKYLEALVRLIMIAGEDGKRGHSHPYFENIPHAPEKPPTKEMTELTIGLAGREPSFFGHDTCDLWGAVEKIKKAAGVGKDWGICKTCGGDAVDPSVKEKYEKWKKEEPPKGEGYQLWETTSEGSPVSPVFKTLEELCAWAEDNASLFGDSKTTKEDWMKMLKEGFVCKREGNVVFM